MALKKTFYITVIICALSVGHAYGQTVLTWDSLKAQADPSQNADVFDRTDLLNLVVTFGDSSGILLRNDLFDDSTAVFMLKAAFKDSVEDITYLNEAQISDLNHFDNDDINLSNAVFDSVDKDVYDDSVFTYKEVTATTYILQRSDAGKTLLCNNADSVRITIPDSASTYFRDGLWVEMMQYGTGPVIVQAGTGVTLLSPFDDSRDSTYAQNSFIMVRKLSASDTWATSGDGK
jgi:hypothetical protein